MKIPKEFESMVKAIEETVLAVYPDIKALVVIGSVAKGDYREDSDVDIVGVGMGRCSKASK